MKKLFTLKGFALLVLRGVRNTAAKLNLSPTTSLFLFGLQGFIPPRQVIPSPVAVNPQKSSTSPTNFCELGEHLENWFDTLPIEKREFTLDELVVWSGIRRETMVDYLKFLKLDFRTWRVGLKLKKVMSLLIDDEDMDISTAARKVGFRDMSNFHRQFKKQVGCSPRVWRYDNCGRAHSQLSRNSTMPLSTKASLSSS